MQFARVIRRASKIVHNALRDLRYGKPLAGTIKTRYAHLGAHDTGNADYDDLDILFADVEVRSADVIVDVGCGKGRSINWFLMRYPANKIIGIEIDADIQSATKRRLRKRANVSIQCGDARALLPAEGTIFYLFNPFDEAAMHRFAEAMLERALPATIVYYNAKCLAPYHENPRFSVTKVTRPNLGFDSAIVTVDAAGSIHHGKPDQF